MKRVLLATIVAMAAGPAGAAQAVTLPPGFADEAVTSVPVPTALAFTGAGDMLITTQSGTLRVRTPGGVMTTALTLGSRVCANSERGLLGVAVDPAFAINGFVYLYYTFNKFGTCPLSGSSTPVNRVSRFHMAGAVADPASETVLVDNIPSPAGNHNGGDLQFGKDGQLYISVGDGGCDYAGNSGCAGNNDAARDRHVLLGKILRITASGAIPSDNPYASSGQRCNVTGSTTAGTNCQETFAWGLRNPFRIAFDPNAAATRFHINDVGQNAWEEIDLASAGADYGWNVREGHCATGSTTNCGAPPPGMTNPIFAYGRGDGCASITGGAFVPTGLWPSSYDGTYLFGDYVCGRIFQLVPNGTGGFNRATFASDLGASSAVHLTFGPRGTGQALYYTTYAGGGEVRRIFFAGDNRAPTADVTASPTSGPPGVVVGFDGSASSDPDAGDTLTYLWDFGDGSPATETAGATTSHAYASAGTYTATLRVRDDHGAVSAPDTVRIDVGNTPPVPTITSPAAGQRFAVGETIALRGTATDAQEGTLPASSLSWTVLRRHDTHTHPWFGPQTGNSSSFTGAAPEDLLATTNSSLEVQLTATDAQGATATVTRVVSPKLVNLTFTSL
jgi:glucose/arabinose dehydrogenase